MNYEKLYQSIIAKARCTVYNEACELHHILPKSLGGSDDAENIVRVPVRLHYVLHCLLYRIHKDTKPNLIFACTAFFTQGKRVHRLNGRHVFHRWVRKAAHFRRLETSRPFLRLETSRPFLRLETSRPFLRLKNRINTFLEYHYGPYRNCKTN